MVPVSINLTQSGILNFSSSINSCCALHACLAVSLCFLLLPRSHSPLPSSGCSASRSKYLSHFKSFLQSPARSFKVVISSSRAVSLLHAVFLFSPDLAFHPPFCCSSSSTTLSAPTNILPQSSLVPPHSIFSTTIMADKKGASVPAPAGERIGSYRLKKTLGIGSFGKVRVCAITAPQYS